MSFIADRMDFAGLEKRAADVFGASPPGFPYPTFASGFGNFKFVDFDETLTRKFWSVLERLGEANGDADISLLMRDPDPVSYYYAHFGSYGALRFARGSTGNDYFRALHVVPDDSPADSLFHIATVVSWCGSSGSWGVWGDRNMGVAVIASRSAPPARPLADGLVLMDVDAALKDVICLNFKNQTVPADVEREFRANYANTRAKHA